MLIYWCIFLYQSNPVNWVGFLPKNYENIWGGIPTVDWTKKKKFLKKNVDPLFKSYIV